MISKVLLGCLGIWDFFSSVELIISFAIEHSCVVEPRSQDLSFGSWARI